MFRAVARASFAAVLTAPALLLAQPALAEEAPPPLPHSTGVPATASLEWNLPDTGGCLEAPRIQEAIRHSLGREAFADAAPLTLHLNAVRRDRRSMRIRIELTEEGQELGARDVDVSLGDCARARETVALVSAMLLEVPRDRPPEEEETEEEKPPTPPVPPKPPPRPAPSRAKAQPTQGVRVVVDTSAFFAVTKGYLPGFGLGGRAEVLLAVGRFIPLRLTAGASVGDTVETPQGSASFRSGEFSLGAAPFRASLGNRASVFVFASGALSSVIASASDFDVSRTEVRWIPSLVAGGALRGKPFGGDFIVSLELGGFVPLSRPAFTVLDPTDPAGTTVLHRVSTAGYDLAAGAGWQFR